jgi:Flp pilus assembly pilin Flp
MTWGIVRKLLADESGGTLVEYAIIAALLSAVGMLGMTGFGTGTSAVLNNQQTGFDTVQTSP